MAEVKLNKIRGYVSDPPGLAIIATAERVGVEAAGRPLAEMRVHRPDHLALMDQAQVANITPLGPQAAMITMLDAEKWARGMRVNLSGGEVLDIGEELVEAWHDHVALHRAARNAESRLVEAQEDRRPKPGDHVKFDPRGKPWN